MLKSDVSWVSLSKNDAHWLARVAFSTQSCTSKNSGLRMSNSEQNKSRKKTATTASPSTVTRKSKLLLHEKEFFCFHHIILSLSTTDEDQLRLVFVTVLLFTFSSSWSLQWILLMRPRFGISLPPPSVSLPRRKSFVDRKKIKNKDNAVQTIIGTDINSMTLKILTKTATTNAISEISTCIHPSTTELEKWQNSGLELLMCMVSLAAQMTKNTGHSRRAIGNGSQNLIDWNISN